MTKCILVVEDQEDNRTILRDLLNHAGFDVLEAVTGEEGVRAAGERFRELVGQSGYLVKWKGHRLLIDPYLSDSLTRKYAGTDKPHVRMTARVIAPEQLDFIDVVTSSHNHTDHLDAETLGPLLAAIARRSSRPTSWTARTSCASA